MSLRVLAGAALAALLFSSAPRAQAPAGAAAAPAPPGQSSKVWIGHEAEYEEFIRSCCRSSLRRGSSP